MTVINDLHQKRAELADDLEGHKRECTWIEEMLDRLDQVLQELGSADPLTARASGTRYLVYGEMRHRCLDAMRDGAIVTAEAVVMQLMRQKYLDPEQHPALRRDLNKRALRALATLHEDGRVEKIGYGRGVQWRLAEADPVSALAG